MARKVRTKLNRGMHNNDKLLQMILSLRNRERPEIPRIPIPESIQRNNDEIARISKEIKEYEKGNIEYIKRAFYLRLLNESNTKLREIQKENDFNGTIQTTVASGIKTT